MKSQLQFSFSIVPWRLLLKTFCFLFIATSSLAQVPTYSHSNFQALDFPFYLVEFNDPSAVTAIKQINSVIVRAEFQTVPFIAIKATNPADITTISNISGVVQVRKEGIYTLSLESSNANTQATLAQEAGKTGEGCGIAILDSGIDPNHCMFAGKIPASACFSTLDFSFQTTSPVSGNLVDVDFFGTCPNPTMAAGFTESQISMSDGSAADACSVFPNFCDHGTHVAGIAGGSACSGTLTTGGAHTSPGGVATGATIIPVNVFSRREVRIAATGALDPDFPPTALAFDCELLLGLEWVLMNSANLNICAVNMSLGGGGPFNTACDAMEVIAPVINDLTNQGIAVAIASGNDGFNTGVSSPACIESAISVGAISDSDFSIGPFNFVDGERVFFSNHLDGMVDLFAPGAAVVSAVGPTNGTANSFDSFFGTSMATPAVAGAFAILKAACPEASVDDMLTALQDTGAAVPGFTTPAIRIHDACLLLLERLHPNIPTLSEWGLMIFGLLILNISIIFIRRRESILA